MKEKLDFDEWLVEKIRTSRKVQVLVIVIFVVLNPLTLAIVSGIAGR